MVYERSSRVCWVALAAIAALLLVACDSNEPVPGDPFEPPSNPAVRAEEASAPIRKRSRRSSSTQLDEASSVPSAGERMEMK